jgi:8-hydroxy-5-deazaflavin:NADPH oxidoreductase
MKIGILGAGIISKTLGAAWARAGHEVFLGARDAKREQLRLWQQEQGVRAQVVSVTEAAQKGELLLLAINPWTEIEKVLMTIQPHLKHKTLIDVSNNIDFTAQPPRLAFQDLSLAQTIQEWAPGAHVVKALNLLPAVMMVNPQAQGLAPALTWISGDQTPAKEMAKHLIYDLGWEEVIDLGDLSASRLQESTALAMTLVISNLMAQQA